MSVWMYRSFSLTAKPIWFLLIGPKKAYNYFGGGYHHTHKINRPTPKKKKKKFSLVQVKYISYHFSKDTVINYTSLILLNLVTYLSFSSPFLKSNWSYKTFNTCVPTGKMEDTKTDGSVALLEVDNHTSDSLNNAFLSWKYLILQRIPILKLRWFTIRLMYRIGFFNYELLHNGFSLKFFLYQ